MGNVTGAACYSTSKKCSLSWRLMDVTDCCHNNSKCGCWWCLIPTEKSSPISLSSTSTCPSLSAQKQSNT